MNLDGITSAKSDSGLGFSCKIGEIAAGASAAFGIARHPNGLHAAGPDIAREQAPMKGLRTAGKEFQGFGRFQRGDEINDWPEDTDGVAGLFESLGGGAGFEKTGEAGRRAGTNRHGQAVTGDAGGVDPRPAGFHGDVVD